MGNNFGYYAAGMIVGNLTASVAIGAVSGGLANMSCIGSAANIARMVGQTLKAAMVVSDAYTVAGAVNEFGETGHWGLNQTLALATVAGHGIGYAAGKLKAPKCFVEGTQVLAQDETGQAVSTNIEEIEVGDWVWSRNEETGEEGFKPVVQLFRNQTHTLVHLTYTTAAGEATLTGTEEHPFWSLTRNTWVGMGGLHTGERLQLVGGQTATATTVRTERLSSPVTVYNFEVADWHTHHVGTADTGWVFVHNKCSPKELKTWLNKGPKDTTVYLGTVKGKTKCVGITNDIVRRTNEHAGRYKIAPLLTGLTRHQGRAIEQAIIKHTGSRLRNILNSIDPRRGVFDGAVEWGEAYLRDKGLAHLLKRSN